MRVLMLCSSYPRFASDSASIFLRHLALALSKSGVDIQVLAPDHSLVDTSVIDPAIQINHFRYFPRRWQTLAYGSGILPNLRQRPLRWLQVPFFLLFMFIALLLSCRRNRPDIIHAHWIIPQGLIAVCVGTLLRIPVITTAHGSDAFSLRGRFLAALKHFVLRHSQAWTANTKATAGNVEHGALNMPNIVPMGVDIFQFGNQAPVTTKRSKHIVLFVGRLVAAKGVSDLLEAFAALPAELRSETELWIIGEGSERTKLEQRAQTLKIDTSVRFLGRIPHDALPGYYATADLYVAPSIIEGQGVALIEAMASGLPVIAYETGGIRDVVSHEETGILIAPRDIQSLSKALVTLLQDSGLRRRLGRQGQHNSRQQYNWEAIAQQLIDVFSSVSPYNSGSGSSS
jgi:glycosyltransferase involved in cell wall biosynthesis